MTGLQYWVEAHECVMHGEARLAQLAVRFAAGEATAGELEACRREVAAIRAQANVALNRVDAEGRDA